MPFEDMDFYRVPDGSHALGLTFHRLGDALAFAYQESRRQKKPIKVFLLSNNSPIADVTYLNEGYPHA